MMYLILNGCSYMGRNLVNRLYQTTQMPILFVDTLDLNLPPTSWLEAEKVNQVENLAIFGATERLFFLAMEPHDFINATLDYPNFLAEKYGWSRTAFTHVFHFGALDTTTKMPTPAEEKSFAQWLKTYQPQQLLYVLPSATSLNNCCFESIHLDTNITYLPSFTIYGPKQDLTTPIAALTARIARRENPLVLSETSQQSYDLVFIEDALDAILSTVHNSTATKMLRIGSQQTTSLLEIVHLLCTIADYEPEIQQNLEQQLPVEQHPLPPKEINWIAPTPLEEGLVHVYYAALEHERAAEVA